MMSEKYQSKITTPQPVLMTEIVMPQHTNPIGVIFGGVIMSWIDIASAIAAGRHCKTHVATASIDAIRYTPFCGTNRWCFACLYFLFVAAIFKRIVFWLKTNTCGENSMS